MNRRQALLVAFGCVALPFHLGEIDAPATDFSDAVQRGTQVRTLFRTELPDLRKSTNPAVLSVLRVRYAPGAESRPHRHPVPAFVYILRGVVESEVEGATKRRFGVGEFFFEEAGHKHLVARNVSSTEPAEFLAVFVGNGNSPLTLPLSQENGNSR